MQFFALENQNLMTNRLGTNQLAFDVTSVRSLQTQYFRFALFSLRSPLFLQRVLKAAINHVTQTTGI